MLQATTQTLPIERWRMSLQLQQAVSLPHLGSALRGAFGHALKALACDCSNEHRPECVYQHIFEPKAPHDWPERFANCPPAFVISPPMASEARRQTIEFEFTLLGPSLVHRGLVWQAWQRAAAQGFTQRLIKGHLKPLAIPQVFQASPRPSALCLELTGPLLLKRKQVGQTHSKALTADQVALSDLLIALHRRLSLVEQLYGVTCQLPPLLHWLQQAEHLTMETQLHEARFARYSNRQQKSMPLYGLLGRLKLHGSISDDLWHAFTLGQWLHIGGKTALGLGGYRLVETPDSSVNDRKSMP